MKVKSITSFVLSTTKLLNVLQYAKLKNKAFILTYHRVIDLEYKKNYFLQPGMFVSKDTFEMHLNFLEKKFKIIFLEDLIRKLKKGENISGYCSITFDDGWVDNYENVFPLLKKYQIPVTIFLATGYIGTNEWFWPEKISFYLSKIIDNNIKLKDLSEDIHKIITNSKLPKVDKINSSVEKLKLLSFSKRNFLIKQLHYLFPIQKADKLFIDWKQVKEMCASDLCSFEAHTVNHKILTQINSDNIREEVVFSKKHIEKMLKKEVTFFAYPNGNSNKEIIKTVIKSNFEGAVTTKRGYLNAKTDLMKIPRISIHNDVAKTEHLFRTRILLKRF